MSVYFEKTRELCDLILNSDEAKKFRQASDELAENQEIVDKINAFSAYQEQISALLSDNSLSPTETETKTAELMQKFEELNKEPLIIAHRDADNAYEALVNKVFDIMNLTLGRNPVPDYQKGCGECAGCNKMEAH